MWKTLRIWQNFKRHVVTQKEGQQTLQGGSTRMPNGNPSQQHSWLGKETRKKIRFIQGMKIHLEMISPNEPDKTDSKRERSNIFSHQLRLSKAKTIALQEQPEITRELSSIQASCQSSRKNEKKQFRKTSKNTNPWSITLHHAQKKG
jgi:hypothetical protein